MFSTIRCHHVDSVRWLLSRRKLIVEPVLHRASSSQRARKHIAPIVNCIHPDRFHNDSAEIKALNLTCLQTLNEIWDVIEGMEEKITHASSSAKIDLVDPFKASYNLSFYSRSQHEQDNSTIEKISLNISIPSLLTQKQNNIPMKLIQADLNRIFHQMGTIFTILGLINPWENLISGKDGKTSSVDDLGMTNEKLQTLIFERAMKYNKHRLIDPLTYDSRSEKEASRLRKDRELLCQEVAYYISQGNVKFRNVSMVEDILLITRIQDFLVQYGPYLNFRLDIWSKVFIILHGDGLADTDKASAKTLDRRAKRMKLYKYERFKGKIVLEAPKDFKAKDFLSFISDNVPFIQDFYYEETLS
jgi:hypothetical protein